jgi:DNA primase
VPRLNNDPFEAAASAMTLLKLDRVNETIQEHKRRMRRADQEGNDDKMRALQQKMMSLYELRKHIENREYLDRDPRHEPR